MAVVLNCKTNTFDRHLCLQISWHVSQQLVVVVKIDFLVYLSAKLVQSRNCEDFYSLCKRDCSESNAHCIKHCFKKSLRNCILYTFKRMKTKLSSYLYYTYACIR